MNTKDIKIAMENGVQFSVTVSRMLGSGYCVQFTGPLTVFYVETARNEMRFFRTMDAVISFLERLEIKKFQVVL